MSAPEILSADDLNAFIDGELDAARADEIAERIAADPALMARVEAFRNDKVMLAAHYQPLLARPLPPEWLARLALASNRRAAPAWRRPLMAIAASVVIALAGWGTYQVVLSMTADAVIDEAMAARAGTLGMASNAAADAAGVSAALGMHLKLPDLGRAGYRLAQVATFTEGRGKGQERSVRLDYRDADNRLLTLYLKPSSGHERFELAKRGELRICLWQDDVLSTVMVGEMSAAEMLRVASLAYNGLYF